MKKSSLTTVETRHRVGLPPRTRQGLAGDTERYYGMAEASPGRWRRGACGSRGHHRDTCKSDLVAKIAEDQTPIHIPQSTAHSPED